MLYLILLHRGMKAAYKSERAFGGLLSAGLSFDLACQALVDMGVVVGLGPITGQPLPLISMGGTSMVFSGLALGIILSVSRGEQEDFATQTEGGNKRITTNRIASKAAERNDLDKQKPYRMIVSGGGTGAHSFPVLAIANESREPHPPL